MAIQYTETMSYTDFISFLRETNRCPGGKNTIRKIRSLIHFDSNTNVLEIGSNTGFTSLELAHITPSNIYGMDISEACVTEANRLLKEDTQDVCKRVRFMVGSAYNIPFGNNFFDVIVTGGATGFMGKKEDAIKEYIRVLKPWGMIAMSTLVYTKTPPQSILDSVSSIIGVKIKAFTTKDWIDIVTKNNKYIESYFLEENNIKSCEENEIIEYVNYFMNKDHIRKLPSKTKEAIKNRWLSHIRIFNENQKYLSYSILLFRKRLYPEEPELFKTTS